MIDDIIFRWYRSGDEHQIIELLDIAMNGWPKFDLQCSQAEHWTWKFLDNPYKRNIICLAEHNKRIIGVTESINLQYKIGSRMYLGLADYDNAVHPDYRGQGIYSDLWKFWEEHPDSELSELEISATSNPLVIKMFLEEGAQPFPRKISVYTKVLDFNGATQNQTFKNKTSNFIGFSALGLENIFSNILKRVRNSNSISIKEIDRFTEDVVLFVEKMYQKHDFIFERSVEYLNWRYCDIRGGDFKVFLATKKSKIVGYMVCRVISRKDMKKGIIVDLLVDQDYVDVAYNLCNTGIDYFDECGVGRVDSWVVQGHWLESVLSSFGFLNIRKEVGIYVGSEVIGPDGDTFSNASPSRLHFQMGDTDWI